MTHTSTPWFAGEVSKSSQDKIEYINIRAGDGYHVCKVSSREFEENGSENEANAKHIVKCVNHHDDLVAACQKVVNNWGNLHHKDLMQLRSILEKVSSDG